MTGASRSPGQAVPATSPPWGAALVVLLCVGVYGFHGLDGLLIRDNSIYYYAGQQLVRGVPPYLSIFDVKTPLTSFVAALGVALAPWSAWPELQTVRVLFVVLAVGTHLGLYGLAARMFRSPWAGILAAASLLALWGLVFQTAAGPRPKVLLLLLETLALLAMTRERWLAAGFLGALGFLTWQPAGILLLVAGLQLGLRAAPRGAWAQLVGGAAGALVPVCLYFGVVGAFREFLDAAIGIHLGVYGKQSSVGGRVAQILVEVRRGFPRMELPLLVGTLGFAFAWLRGLRGPGRGRDSRVGDLLPLGLAFASFAAWTLFDFQRYPDLFPLLPFAALGMGGVFHGVTAPLRRGDFGSSPLGAALVGGCSLALLMAWGFSALATGGPFQSYQAPWPRLDAQLRFGEALLAEVPADAAVVSIGAPHFLSLMQRKNLSRHIVINSGIDRYIEASTPGGFEGWLDDLEGADPELLVLGRSDGELVPRIHAWVESRYVRWPYGEPDLPRGAGWSAWVRRPRGPGVLLVTLDTLRVDHLGAYGSENALTPYIDALAERSTVFERAAAPMPLTRPSHFSIFTSLYPREHGVLDNQGSLPETFPTLAERLGEAGYRTGGFVAVRLLGEDSGAARGFDSFDSPSEVQQRRAEEVVPRALAWLDQLPADASFFLWVHLFDPHQPYDPPGPFRRDLEPRLAARLPSIRWRELRAVALENEGDVPAAVLDHARDLYRGEVEYLDHWVGRLLAGVEALRGPDETLVVLTADHGECFEGGVFFEHSHCLLEGATRIPLILHHPPSFLPGTRVAGQVSSIDIAPTILRALELEVPDGLSGVALQDAGEALQERHVLVQHPFYRSRDARTRVRRNLDIRSVAGEPTAGILLDAERVGVVGGGWKYLRTGSPGSGDAALYRVSPAADEVSNQLADEPGVRTRMEDELNRQLEAHPLVTTAPGPLTPELLKTLRALGYVE